MQLQERSESIKQLAELICGVDIAMFTTVSVDGKLVSEPLGTQEVEFDGDLWFANAANSPKVAEIAADPRGLCVGVEEQLRVGGRHCTRGR